MQIDLSLEEQLLKSSLLCGLKPKEKTVNRFKLFFVANKELGSKSHESDLQRALETGVDNNIWENWPAKRPGIKGSGEYRITRSGYEMAITQFPGISPKCFPNCFSLEGYIDGIKLLIAIQDNKRTIFVNDESCSGKEACRYHLDIPEETMKNESAVRIIYNLAIDNDFKLYWGNKYGASGYTG